MEPNHAGATLSDTYKLVSNEYLLLYHLASSNLRQRLHGCMDNHQTMGGHSMFQKDFYSSRFQAETVPPRSEERPCASRGLFSMVLHAGRYNACFCQFLAGLSNVLPEKRQPQCFCLPLRDSLFRFCSDDSNSSLVIHTYRYGPSEKRCPTRYCFSNRVNCLAREIRSQY